MEKDNKHDKSLMIEASSRADIISAEVAKKAGVGEKEARAVLQLLGIDRALAGSLEVVRPEAAGKINAESLGITVKLSDQVDAA